MKASEQIELAKSKVHKIKRHLDTMYEHLKQQNYRAFYLEMLKLHKEMKKGMPIDPAPTDPNAPEETSKKCKPKKKKD